MKQNLKKLKPVGIVIVSYKTTDKTIEYIKYELSKIKSPIKIVVVNNSFSLADNKKYLSALDVSLVSDYGAIRKEKNIFIINSEKNLGFAKGNNLGARFLIEHFQPEYLLFSNNDIEIISENVIEKLAAKVASNPKIGFIGPKMLDCDGRSISPRHDRVGPLRYALWHLFYPVRNSQVLSILNIKSPGVGELIKRHHQVEGFCYWVTGSFMLVRTDIFIKIDGFDPYTFLYSEEKILAERLKIHGYGMYFCPEVSVLSLGEYTTSRYLQDIEKKILIFDNDLYYYKKYFKINILLLRILTFARFIYFTIYNRFYKNLK